MTMQEGLPVPGPGCTEPSHVSAMSRLTISTCSATATMASAATRRPSRPISRRRKEFKEQGAQCSHALGLLKIADSYLSLAEPWHAIGYLEACLPLLRDLGLTRHEGLARQQLDACQAELAGARLLGEGRVGQRP